MRGKQRFALVALDIDETLVEDATQRPSATVVEALRSVRRAGAHVVLATGKSMYGAQTIIDQLGLGAGYCVASYGAVTFAYHPYEVKRALRFDPRPAVEEMLARMPDALVAVEVVGRGYRANGLFPEGELAGSMCIEPVEQLVREPVTRLVLRDREVPPLVALQIGPEGASKLAGLAALAAELGVAPSDVLAIGDGPNDVEMLRWAGRGVAMANASDEVRAVADAVTDSVQDDGVATELARWFGPGRRAGSSPRRAGGQSPTPASTEPAASS